MRSPTHERPMRPCPRINWQHCLFSLWGALRAQRQFISLLGSGQTPRGISFPIFISKFLAHALLVLQPVPEAECPFFLGSQSPREEVYFSSSVLLKWICFFSSPPPHERPMRPCPRINWQHCHFSLRGALRVQRQFNARLGNELPPLSFSSYISASGERLED